MPTPFLELVTCDFVLDTADFFLHIVVLLCSLGRHAIALQIATHFLTLLVVGVSRMGPDNKLADGIQSRQYICPENAKTVVIQS